MGRADVTAVIVDAGPVIHLAELGCLDLLSDVAPMMAPMLVWQEVQHHCPTLTLSDVSGLTIIAGVAEPSERLLFYVDTLGLDAGETGALALAEQQGVHMFLTDDSAARFAAESQGLEVHGSVGLIVRAIRRGLRSRAEVLDTLADIPKRSTLHLSRSLLVAVIENVAERS